MIRVRITGHKKARARWLRVANKIQKGEKQTVHNVLIAGRNLAKNIAPIDTKAMINAIKIKTLKGSAGWIISDQPNRTNRGGDKVPYHLWMHGIEKDISRRIKSGDPHFMFSTFDELKIRFPKQMRDMVKVAITTP